MGSVKSPWSKQPGFWSLLNCGRILAKKTSFISIGKWLRAMDKYVHSSNVAPAFTIWFEMFCTFLDVRMYWEVDVPAILATTAFQSTLLPSPDWYIEKWPHPASFDDHERVWHNNLLIAGMLPKKNSNRYDVWWLSWIYIYTYLVPGPYVSKIINHRNMVKNTLTRACRNRCYVGIFGSR